MKQLAERVAVVTGAASGLGLALAERFATEGMKVVLADIEAAALTEAEKRVKKTGAATLSVRMDVRKAEEVQTLAEKTLEEFGAVHVVCNNAGVYCDPSPVWELTEDDWQWILGVNLWGVIHGIRTFVPILLEQGSEGHVVNMSSMGGHMALPFLSSYHATKHAVVAISESLHHELAISKAKVRVSVVCPGATRTAIVDSERNRPSSLGDVGWGSASAFRAKVAEFVAGGAEPSMVADHIVNAIRDERFYVFTHPQEMPAIRSRMEGILAEENPTLDLPDEMREILGL